MMENILYVVNSKFSNIQTHFIFYSRSVPFRSVPQITNIHTSIGILRNGTEPKLIIVREVIFLSFFYILYLYHLHS